MILSTLYFPCRQDEKVFNAAKFSHKSGIKELILPTWH